jgi:aspartyl-tRNA synthetase
MNIKNKLIAEWKKKEETLNKVNNIFKTLSVNPSDEISWYINKIEYTPNITKLNIANQYWVVQVLLEWVSEIDRDNFDAILNWYIRVSNWAAQAIAITLNQENHVQDRTLTIDSEDKKKYPYLHYRAGDNFEAMRERYKIISQIRDYLWSNKFIELETPILWPVFYEYTWNSFLTKDDLLWGYYSLPQSPQPYKQLSILSWVQKYFQIARCFRRDADWAYRKIEFTQIDVELSTNNSRDIMDTLEWLVKHLFLLKWIELDEKIPVFTYEEAIRKFWTDKPILEWKEYSLVWIVKAPIFELNAEKDLVPSHHIVSKPLSEDLHLLDSKPLQVRGDNYDLILNGQEVAWWDIRIDDPLLQYKMFKKMWYSDEHIEKHYMRFIEALSKWCPWHGGFATGVERLITLLNHHNDIEKYILFPKHKEWDPLTWHPIKL